MKPISLVSVLAAGLGLAARLHATVTVTNYWRMGEDDPGAASGIACTNTVDEARGWVITNTEAGSMFLQKYPDYTTNVAAAAAAEAVSDLSVDYPSGQYGTGSVIPGLTNNFGIECWLNPATNSSGGAVVVYNGNTGGSGWGLFQSGTNLEAFFGDVGFFGSAPIPTNAWTHAALVRDSGTATLYVNGVAAGTSTLNPIPPAGNFLVAANNSHIQNFNGAVDEIRVFTFVPGQFSTNDLLLYASAVVANTNDSGAGSLRQVLAQAPNSYTITFNPNLSGQTITLHSLLQININLAIDASALPGGIQISGHNAVQIFDILSPNSVSLRSLNLVQGDALGGNGGAIQNDADLTLIDCTLSGNFAVTVGSGGGDGGAIYNYDSGTVLLDECTLTGNAASKLGGCIYDTGVGPLYNIQLQECTLSANASDLSGGGIYTVSAVGLYVDDSIVSSNLPSDIEAGSETAVDLAGKNIIGVLNATANPGIGFTGQTYITNTTPNLAPLGNYGGPTQTMPPLPGSPAIGAGSVAANTFTNDQRGYPRTQNGLIDIGAVQLPTVKFTTSPTNDWQPNPVQFSAPGVDSDGATILQWYWSFGDNQTSGWQDPVHAYSITGVFAPGLIVTNSLGLILAASGPAITVYPPLTLTGVSLSGTNLTLNGTNGVSGLAYSVLSSTNLALPLSQWTPLTTNTWSANGAFSLTLTNVPPVPGRFYLLRVP